MVEYELVKESVRKINLEEGYISFECGGLDHLLVYYDTFEDSESPAYYIYPSSMVSGADIILSENIPEEFKRPILLHEVAEFLLRNPKDGQFEQGKLVKSHNIASQWDEKFSKEILSENTYLEYINYKSKFLNL